MDDVAGGGPSGQAQEGLQELEDCLDELADVLHVGPSVITEVVARDGNEKRERAPPAEHAPRTQTRMTDCWLKAIQRWLRLDGSRMPTRRTSHSSRVAEFRAA